MGTIITLNINKLGIDWGKNNYYNAHSWLYENKKFQIKYDDYNYHDGALAISNNLNNIKFRLNHLGYSLDETKKKFDKILTSWKHTHDFVLSFDILKRIVLNIDLEVLTDRKIFAASEDYWMTSFYDWLSTKIEEDTEYIKLKREYIANLTNNEEYFDALNDFFLEKIDRYIILRLFCENEKNLSYELNWFCHDIIESGWASIEDINVFDDKNFIIEHNKLFGKMQKYAVVHEQINSSVTAMDEWLVSKGVSKTTKYVREDFHGRVKSINYTLPTFVRNVVHHPENTRNRFSDSDLMESVNIMLEIVKNNNIVL